MLWRRLLPQRAIALVAALVCFATVGAGRAGAVDKAEAAKGPPLDVAVFLSSRRDVCYDPGDVRAIKTLMTAEQERLNRGSGIAGRPIVLRFFDDNRDAKATVTNWQFALDNPQLVAMIGQSGSDRAKPAFEAHGRRIRDSGIPFITDQSVTSLFKDIPNAFTMRSSQDQERIPLMLEAIRQLGYQRIAYVGLQDALYSSTLGDALKEALGSQRLIADHRLPTEKDQIAEAALTGAIADLKDKQPDMIVLGIGGSRTAAIMTALAKAETTPALFVIGNINQIAPEVRNAYLQPLFQIAWERLPELYNSRLRQRVDQDAADSWVFEGAKIPEAPDWAAGKCAAREESETPDPFTDQNLRAISIGTQYADMLGLVAEAALTAPNKKDLGALRRHIAQSLTASYAPGRAAFKGTFENWSFDPASRAAVRTPMIVMLPGGLGRTQLAPFQLLRTKSRQFRRIDTFYVDIDLIKAHRIEDNEKAFSAEFYLSLRDTPGAGIERIDFTNAFVDPRTNGRHLTVETVHAGGGGDAYADTMKIYKVSGRFLFKPDLAAYPFDKQRFTIDIQPRRGMAPFIVQPPPDALRDKLVDADGWEAKDQYVGYEEDFVPVIDAFTHEPSVVPFYKASFSWIMKRQTTDYFLRVVVPLGFILIVAYLSVFIPQSNFEAIVTIQVTALLSAVALYLSLPKLDSDTATLSDRMFVFNYFMVSLMIALSIARVSPLVAGRPRVGAALRIAHLTMVPILVAAMALYVFGLSNGE